MYSAEEAHKYKEHLQWGQGEPPPTLVLGTFIFFERDLLVAILSPKNARFEVRDPDLLLAWDIYNI